MDKYLFLDTLRVSPGLCMLQSTGGLLKTRCFHNTHTPAFPSVHKSNKGLQRRPLLRAPGPAHGRAPPHRLHAHGRAGLPYLFPHLHPAAQGAVPLVEGQGPSEGDFAGLAGQGRCGDRLHRWWVTREWVGGLLRCSSAGKEMGSRTTDLPQLFDTFTAAPNT